MDVPSKSSSGQGNGPGMMVGEEMMRHTLTRSMYLLVALLTMGLASTSARADTVQLTLTGTGGVMWGSDLIYPYYFTVKDGNTTANKVALMCISFNRTVTIGETWDANLMTAAAADAQYNTTKYEEAAYFLSLAAPGTSARDSQLAAWWLFEPSTDPTYQTLKSEMTPGAWALVNNAPSSLVLSQYANDAVYIALGGSAQYGLAQDFVGLTPEPATWSLLISGLIGILMLVYFRRRAGVRTEQLGS